MSKTQYWNNFRIETPARYRIRIRGDLDSAWSDRLAGMSIQSNINADGAKVTILTGHLPDQAALSGVLNTLNEMHFPLLSVENLDEPTVSSPEQRIF